MAYEKQPQDLTSSIPVQDYYEYIPSRRMDAPMFTLSELENTSVQNRKEYEGIMTEGDL